MFRNFYLVFFLMKLEFYVYQAKQIQFKNYNIYNF